MTAAHRKSPPSGVIRRPTACARGATGYIGRSRLCDAAFRANGGPASTSTTGSSSRFSSVNRFSVVLRSLSGVTDTTGEVMTSRALAAARAWIEQVAAGRRPRKRCRRKRLHWHQAPGIVLPRFPPACARWSSAASLRRRFCACVQGTSATVMPSSTSTRKSPRWAGESSREGTCFS